MRCTSGTGSTAWPRVTPGAATECLAMVGSTGFLARKWKGEEPKDGVKGTRKGAVWSLVETGTATGGLARVLRGLVATVCAVGPSCFLARRWVVGVEFASDTMVAVATGHYCRPGWWNEGHR